MAFSNAMDHKIWRFSIPEWLTGNNARTTGVYTAGALYSLGFYFFIDASVYSHSAKNGSDVHVKFIDWLPAIFSSLGMLVINLIDKSRLGGGNGFSYSPTDVAWQAKVVLFLGFAMLAGGLAGSVTVLVLKYIVPNVPWPALYFGIANVITNALIMLSSIVLWVCQNIEDEYSYNVQI